MSKRTVACAAAAIGVALAGCGGGSSTSSSVAAVTSSSATAAAGAASTSTSSSTSGPADFKTGFAASKATFKKLGADLASDVEHANTKTDAQIATEFGALATRARQQATDLSRLTVPATYQTPITALITGFNSVAADLTAISRAGVSHSVKSAETATKKLLADAAKVKAADNAVSKGLGCRPAERGGRPRAPVALGPDRPRTPVDRGPKLTVSRNIDKLD
jgi:hypothetical protein